MKIFQLGTFDFPAGFIRKFGFVKDFHWHGVRRHLEGVPRLVQRMETAEKKGEAKGRTEGRAEGEAQKTVEIARNLKACGVDVATIAQTTGLSKEDISAL